MTVDHETCAERTTDARFGTLVGLISESCSDPVAAGIERFVGLEHLTSRDTRVRRWGLVADGTSFTKMFKPGQVLFCKRRAYLRKVAVADFSGVCSGDIYVLEPTSDALDPQLLAFICQSDSFIDHAVTTSDGSLSPRTKWSDLEDFEFQLPSRTEQARVVELLQATSRLFESASDLLAAAVVLRQSMLADVGKRFSPNLARESDLVRIGDLLELVREGVTVDAEENYQEIGVRSFGRGVFHKETIVGADLGNKRVFWIEPERLIVNVVFAWEGAVAITGDADSGKIGSHRFPMFVPKRENISLAYLKYFLLSPEGLQLLGNASPGGAGRNRTLGQSRFFAQQICLPSYQDQLAIVRDIDAIEAFIVRLEERKAMAESLHFDALRAAIGHDWRAAGV